MSGRCGEGGDGGVEDADVWGYTAAERWHIFRVLERDTLFRRRHRLNVTRLKGELQILRRKGAVCANGGGRSCGRCRGELGRIINRGACCPACRQRVCKSCREYGRPNPTQWLCTVCHKHMELRAATGDWMNDFVCGPNKGKDHGINATETIKRSLQRSWTFSDTSPSPWSYLRGSPEMRAYNSMPRHQDCDFLPSALFNQSHEKNIDDQKTISDDSAKREVSEICNLTENSSKNNSDAETKTVGTDSAASDMEFPGTSEVSSVESSPVVDKRGFREVVEPMTGAIFRRVVLRDRRVDARNLPAGVTPPRSRRQLHGTSISNDDHHWDGLHLLETAKSLVPESDDYKLVFISSDSSSREELHSDDASSTTSSLRPPSNLDDCDWDYFEYCYAPKPERKEWPWVNWRGDEGRAAGGSTVAADRTRPPATPSPDSRPPDTVRCTSCSLPFHVPIPVPVPVPVPFFVPVPWNPADFPSSVPLYPFKFDAPKNEAMTTGQSLRFDGPRFGVVPESEILPVDELLCNKAVSSVLVSDKSELDRDDGVVLKLYKALDTTDRVPISVPEEILRVTEDRLKDFTEIRDDQSVSSTSSEDDGNPRVPSVRVYRLARDSSEDESSGGFSLAATPPRSLTSSSNSSDEESTDGEKCNTFSKTFVVNDSDSDGDCNESEGETNKLAINNNLGSLKNLDQVDPLTGSHSADPENAQPADHKSLHEIVDKEKDCIAPESSKLDQKTPNKLPILSDNNGKSNEGACDSCLVSNNNQSTCIGGDIIEVSAGECAQSEPAPSETGAGQAAKAETSLDDPHTRESHSESRQNFTDDDTCSTGLPSDISTEVAKTDSLSPARSTLSSSQDDKPSSDGIATVSDENRGSEVIDSIITFSHVEILQIMSEFLQGERYLTEMEGQVEKVNKNVESETSPETRSNTSDEFSGTESMEMPLEDPLECGGARGAEEAGQRRGQCAPATVPGETCKETGRYTSLVMITQQEHTQPATVTHQLVIENGSPTNDQVTVVTGANTLSAVCLEEGLADDDSWVEELDRDELATTTEESSEEEAFPDREEELRGYHRSAIDFTLHTIVEESCEESEVEFEKNRPTELEKYFVFSLGEFPGDDDREIDTLSETSSVFSEGLESVGGGEQQSDNNCDPAELASSRLEKYFLNGFKDFRRRDSDGSVGSDSEGKPSPEQRRKRLVRARGTTRQHSNSLDNLAESEQLVDPQLESEGSSTETDSHDDQSNSFEKNDGQFDTVKRTKKKKRSVSSAPSMELLETPEDCIDGSKEEQNSDEGKKTPQPEFLNSTELSNARNKQQSRDSGFMGSCDDLLKESKDYSGTESGKIDEEISFSASKTQPEKILPELTKGGPPAVALTRKDSFNNWSSDEETNLMMSKMRAFFKTMVGSQSKGASPNVKPKTKPPQLVYFESELTRLMKTVPGLKDEQVKEIVEYLSSEDTWSDSYDSSDYTSSDLESGNKKTALQEEISASCRQIISNFESSDTVDDPVSRPANDPSGNDSVYQRIVASFSKIEAPAPQNSPPLIEKVMQHIGTRLVALMHEVSNGEGTGPRPGGKHHRRLQSKLSATSTTEEEEDSTEDYGPLPRSKSHDPLLEENRQETSDNERFSWRGSFESALMASTDSRTRLASGGEGSASASALALAAKRRSAGDLMFRSGGGGSRERLDRVRSCGSIGGSLEDKIWAHRGAQRRNRSSESGGSADGDDDSEEEEGSGRGATLPRLQAAGGGTCGAATNSLPRLPTCPGPPAPTPIYKAHSVNNVKSARYRPPGYRANTPAALPPRRDQRRRPTPSPSSNLSHTIGCDDTSVCSEPVGRGVEDEVVERLHRASLGMLISHTNETTGRDLKARSDSLASVYSGAGEGRHGGVAVKGEVQLALQYNYKQSSLEIHVKQCRDLAPVDVKRNRSDPYVKVYLLPDKSKSGKRKTRVKKHTLNPIFEETLRFQVNLDGLETRTLWLSVWHSDMFGRNDFLGEVLMPLENKVFDDPLPKFYTLQERSETLEELNSKGELIVGLKFVPPEGNVNKKRPTKGSLLVLVKEAKNLPAVKSNGTSDPFCKSYLLPDKGRGSKQKAPVVRRTCNPAWNHTFTYNNVSLPELSERSLELTIWDHDRLASNEFLGGVRLNLGSGKHNGKVVDWMDSSGNEITLWQRMIEKPNFWVESCLPLRPSLDVRKN